MQFSEQESDTCHALECSSLESNREDDIYWRKNNLQEQVCTSDTEVSIGQYLLVTSNNGLVVRGH